MVNFLLWTLALDGLQKETFGDYSNANPWSFLIYNFHDILPRGILREQLNLIGIYFLTQSSSFGGMVFIGSKEMSRTYWRPTKTFDYLSGKLPRIQFSEL